MMQNNIPVFHEIAGPDLIADELLQLCNSKHDAIRLAWQSRRTKYSQNEAATTLNGKGGKMDKAKFSRVLDGHFALPNDMEDSFEELVGNFAILQFDLAERGTFELLEWFATHMGYDLIAKQQTLEEENAELKRQLREARANG